MEINKDIVGKIIIWYENEDNFGSGRVKHFHPDGGVIEFIEEGVNLTSGKVSNCFDTDVVAILDEAEMDQYGRPKIHLI